MKKKRIAARAVCLIIAGVILTGALTVAAVMGSPYETLKNAVFDALMLENVTIVGKAVGTFDGETEVLGRIHEARSDVGTFRYVFDWYGELSGWVYDSNEITIRTSSVIDGVQWYTVEHAWIRGSRGFSNPITGGWITSEDRASGQFRLIELAVDLIVGDMKHNFTMVSQGDGVRRVTAAFTENQLPEILRVLRDVWIEDRLSWYGDDFGNREDFDNPMYAPPRSINIDRIQIIADVDSDGNLIYLNAGATLTATTVFGDVGTADIGVVANFTDIGTTVPEIPITGAKELFTPEFIDTHHRYILGRWLGLYFTLDADGNIDMDSIGTDSPRSRLFSEE